jgi:hypothetical protein
MSTILLGFRFIVEENLSHCTKVEHGVGEEMGNIVELARGHWRLKIIQVGIVAECCPDGLLVLGYKCLTALISSALLCTNFVSIQFEAVCCSSNIFSVLDMIWA